MAAHAVIVPPSDSGTSCSSWVDILQLAPRPRCSRVLALGVPGVSEIGAVEHVGVLVDDVLEPNEDVVVGVVGVLVAGQGVAPHTSPSGPRRLIRSLGRSSRRLFLTRSLQRVRRRLRAGACGANVPLTASGVGPGGLGTEDTVDRRRTQPPTSSAKTTPERPTGPPDRGGTALPGYRLRGGVVTTETDEASGDWIGRRLRPKTGSPSLTAATTTAAPRTPTSATAEPTEATKSARPPAAVVPVVVN